MQKQIAALILLASLTGIFNYKLVAQSSKKVTIERASLPPTQIEFDDPLVAPVSKEKKSSTPLSSSEKEIMQRIHDIYVQHAQSVQAQINDDPLAAEEHITDALKAIQGLLDDYPDIPDSKRFDELYRTVYTEYEEFYGIEKAENQVNGQVFAVRRELYNDEDDDWLKGRYVLPDNITTAKTEVPLVQNEYVSRHLMYYTLRRPEVMQKWLERSKEYFPMMKKIFREEGVPPELVHLSMIESGLNPVARSWASAVGMWQFIRATGSVYGLEVNWWMDERRDPEKATRAAARHLKDLHDIWGDWYLAIANYNISPRGLKRAIAKGGGKNDYWSAYDYLPRETQGYIPGFIATTMIDLNASEFGFDIKNDVEPYTYDVAEVAPLMPLDELAKAAGISTKKIKAFNPELLRWATPPGNTYPLKLPPGTRAKFIANYKKLPKDKLRRRIAMHTVSRGETLGRIARRYGTTVRAIYESNEKLGRTIYPGQKIVVPVAPGSMQKIVSSKPANQARSKSSSRQSKKTKTPSNSSKVAYTVKSGDNVGYIAEWYDVRASQIRAWNRTSNTINVGERLTIYIPKGKEGYYKQVDGFSRSKKKKIEQDQKAGKNVTVLYAAKSGKNGSVQYKVRKNDTLSEIADSFGVSVTEIKRTNNLRNSHIYVGQELRINKIN